MVIVVCFVSPKGTFSGTFQRSRTYPVRAPGCTGLRRLKKASLPRNWQSHARHPLAAIRPLCVSGRPHMHFSLFRVPSPRPCEGFCILPSDGSSLPLVVRSHFLFLGVLGSSSELTVFIRALLTQFIIQRFAFDLVDTRRNMGCPFTRHQAEQFASLSFPSPVVVFGA